MLNKNATSEVATILYGEQLTLWDLMDQVEPETTLTNETATETVQTNETAQADAVDATTKPLDDGHTMMVVVALSAIAPLAGKWKPP